MQGEQTRIQLLLKANKGSYTNLIFYKLLWRQQHMGWFQHDRAGTAVPGDNGHGHIPRALSIFRFQTTAWHQKILAPSVTTDNHL